MASTKYAAAAMACSMMVCSSAAAEVRALLVAANVYRAEGIPDLQGPGNDVAEVEKLVRDHGASDVTVLRDDQVTRTGVESVLHELGLRSKPGDMLVFMYAGHGAQAEAAVKGEKKNDLDDFLVLPHLNVNSPAPETYITSADLRAWLSSYMPSSVTVLQMVDACHSGTLQRKADPRAPRFTPRLAFRLRTGPDALHLAVRPPPQFPSVAGSIGESLGGEHPDYLPNVLYISAAQDDQFAEEAPLPDAASPSHGVLTYNFLSALTATRDDGKALLADTNGDGVVSMGELAVYLDSQTRIMTEQEQEPSIHFDSQFQDRPLFSQTSLTVKSLSNPVRSAIYADSDRAVAIITSEATWSLAPSAAAADYVWDFKTGDVVRRGGDVVARKIFTAAALKGVTEKWTTIGAVRPYLRETLARVEIGPDRNGARYAPGAHVNVKISAESAPPDVGSSSKRRFATVFNLASDGQVQSLYPDADDGEGEMTGAELPILMTEVVEPYGTDHVVALLTPERPDDFRALLRTVNGSRQSGRLVSALKRELDKGGAEAGLSIGELFTGPGDR